MVIVAPLLHGRIIYDVVCGRMAEIALSAGVQTDMVERVVPVLILRILADIAVGIGCLYAALGLWKKDYCSSYSTYKTYMLRLLFFWTIGLCAILAHGAYARYLKVYPI